MSLCVTDVSCQYDERPLFHPITFSLQPGEAMHLMGENGAGKSTLLRALAGLNPTGQGSMVWHHKPQLLYVGHSLGLKQHLTAMENLLFFRALYQSAQQKVISTTTIQAVLRTLRLQEYQDKPLQFLSAGQQRRVALAKLSCFPANIWLLDEPLTALDKISVDWLMTSMQDFLSTGGMIIFASHQSIILSPLKKIILTPIEEEAWI